VWRGYADYNSVSPPVRAVNHTGIGSLLPGLFAGITISTVTVSMVLAPHLIETYAEYKKGTDTFVQWFVETARATGTVAFLFESGVKVDTPAPTPAGGRLKGKARKQAKTEAPKPTLESQKISINVFAQLAHAIANDKTAKVPPSIFGILRSVIRGRKECATWFISNQIDASDTMRENNEGHQHFIAVLEHVMNILKVKEPSLRKAVSQTTTPAIDQITNVYECLHFEDTVEPDDLSENVPLPTPSGIYKLESMRGETSFAIFCLLRDMTSLRILVRRTWREFKRGSVVMQTAALIMNAAIAKMEEMNNEFRTDDSNLDTMSHFSILDFVDEHCCNKQNGEVLIKPDQSDETGNSFAYDHDGQKLQPDTMMCRHTADLIFNYIFAPEKMIHLSFDEKRLLTCFFHLSSLLTTTTSVKPGQRGFCHDMTLEAVRTLVHEYQFTTWAVFAIQILWDTQRELNQTVQIGKEALNRIGRSLETRWRRYIDTPGLSEVSATYGKASAMVKEHIVKIEGWTHGDAVQQLIDTCGEQKKSLGFKGLENYSLLNHHPGLCGAMAADLQTDYQIITIDIAASQSQILTVAHLYNAARQCGLLPNRLSWKDLDWFIDQQGSEWIYAGPTPKTPHEFFVRLEIVLGSRAPTAKKRTTEQAVGKNRRFRCMSRRDEFCLKRNELRRVMGPSEIHNNVSALADAVAIDFLGSRKAFRRMSTTNKLLTFKDAVEKDNFSLSFDSMALYLRCLKLLQCIQAYCHKNAPIDYPEKAYQTGLGMNGIVLDIFLGLNGKPRFHESMFPIAVGFLREVIEAEGDVGICDAETQQAQSRLVNTQSDPDNEPDFENPQEDMLPLEFRNWFCGNVIVDRGDGDIRTPFR
jgi:hypothetical protein